MTIPLDVRPTPVSQTPSQTGATLTVLVESGDYRDSRSLKGFAVQVDGEVRDWIENVGDRADLSVSEGLHEVTLMHSWRQVGILFGVPLPESGSVESHIRVTCNRGTVCAVAYWPMIDHQKGLVLSVREIAPEELKNFPAKAVPAD